MKVDVGSAGCRAVTQSHLSSALLHVILSGIIKILNVGHCIVFSCFCFQAFTGNMPSFTSRFSMRAIAYPAWSHDS
jgi:hypothetical protein